jgi:hypothetical protein
MINVLQSTLYLTGLLLVPYWAFECAGVPGAVFVIAFYACIIKVDGKRLIEIGGGRKKAE